MKCPQCFSPWVSEQNLIHRFDCGSNYCLSFLPQLQVSMECCQRKIKWLTDEMEQMKALAKNSSLV